jgi:hypothetical protein
MYFKPNVSVYRKAGLADDPKAIFQTTLTFDEKPIAGVIVQQAGWSRHPGYCHLGGLESGITQFSFIRPIFLSPGCSSSSTLDE